MCIYQIYKNKQINQEHVIMYKLFKVLLRSFFYLKKNSAGNLLYHALYELNVWSIYEFYLLKFKRFFVFILIFLIILTYEIHTKNVFFFFNEK